MMPFSCRICSKECTTKGNLKVHEFLHSGQKPFSCDLCEKSFALKSSLKVHYLTHTKIRNFSCEICKKTFSTKGDMKKHMIVHTTIKKFCCLNCNLFFKNKGSYNVHICKKISKCRICEETFPDKSTLEQHSHTHPKESTFICQLCNKHFKFKHRLKHHHSTVHSEIKRLFSCQTCNASFKRYESLQKHLLIHTDAGISEKHVCHICEKKFISKYSFKLHLKRHTNSRTFLCDICKKKFHLKQDLNKHHKTVHLRIRSYKCEICDKSFTTLFVLKRHNLVHTGEKPYICDVCNISFTQKGSFTRHMAVHSLKKQYTCDKCNRHFYQKDGLERHKVFHNGKRPYMCDKCNKSFYLEGSLERHKLLHDEKRPYSCDKCDKFFAKKCNLTQHYSTHSDMKQYSCDKCNRSFAYIHSLKQHKCCVAKTKSPKECCHIEEKDVLKLNIKNQSNIMTNASEDKSCCKIDVIEIDKHLQNCEDDVESSHEINSFVSCKTFRCLNPKNVDIALKNNIATQSNNELDASHVGKKLKISNLADENIISAEKSHNVKIPTIFSFSNNHASGEKNIFKMLSKSLDFLTSGKESENTESCNFLNIGKVSESSLLSENIIFKNNCHNKTATKKLETYSKEKGHCEESILSNNENSNVEQDAAYQKSARRKNEVINKTTKKIKNCIKHQERWNLKGKLQDSKSHQSEKEMEVNKYFAKDDSESVSHISVTTTQNKRKYMKDIDFISIKELQVDTFTCTPSECGGSETLCDKLNKTYQSDLYCVQERNDAIVDFCNNFKSRPMSLPRKVSFKLNILDIYNRIKYQ